MDVRSASAASSRRQRLVHVLIHRQREHPVSNLLARVFGHEVLGGHGKIHRHVRGFEIVVVQVLRRARRVLVHRLRDVEVPIEEHERVVELIGVAARDTSLEEGAIGGHRADVSQQTHRGFGAEHLETRGARLGANVREVRRLEKTLKLRQPRG